MLAPDDEIDRYLDWLPSHLAGCQIRQLLFHTSGIRDQWALGYFAGLRSGDTIQTDDVRRWLKDDDELNFEPGALGDGTPLRCGFGQIHTSVAGHPVAMHGGFDYGFNSICIRCMDAPIGSFAAGNGSFSMLESSALDVLSACLGGEARRPESTSPASLPEAQPTPQGVFATDDYADVRAIEHQPDGHVWLNWMQGFELKRQSPTDWSVVGTQIVARLRKRSANVALEFSNGTDTTAPKQVSRMPAEETALVGEYFAPTLGSVLTVRRSHAGLAISIGRNISCNLDVVSPALFMWACYWGTPVDDGGSIVELRISHPRCLGVKFVRI